jgi:hypothetical protein
MIKPYRRSKELGPVKSARFPQYVVFWDVESYISKEFSELPHRFRLGWACVRREPEADRVSYEWHALREPSGFWALLDSIGGRKCEIWAFAHNVVYDFFMVGGIKALLDRGYALRSVYCRGAVTILRAQQGGRTVVFLDTLNFFQGPLAVWGESIGIPKGSVDFQASSDEDVSEYCKRDVLIILKLVERWFALCRKHRLGGASLTAGGQAFRAYRHRFLQSKIYIHNNEPVLRLERKAYFGGRTECFYVGALPPGRYAMLDVNSMYPYVMKHMEYPCKLKWHFRGGSVEELRGMAAGHAVVARVRLATDRPVFPYRQGLFRTLFPVGEFWTVLTTPELRTALDGDEITHVAEVAVYDKAILFSKYVDELYRLRMDLAVSDPLWSKLIKVLLNSLYGKFGQRSETWVARPNVEHFLPGRLHYTFGSSPEFYTALCLGPIVWYCVGHGEGRNAFPAVAAHVTAYARCVLWDYIQKAGVENVYYCDTDSLLVNDAGRGRLESRCFGAGLGRLKVECESVGGVLRAPKDYDLDDRHKVKGITRNAVLQDDGSYVDLQWPKLSMMLEDGILEGYRNRVVRKVLKRTYDKGIVTASGRVVPFRFSEPVACEGRLPF